MKTHRPHHTNNRNKLVKHKLLGCPFCGGKAEFYPDSSDNHDSYGVSCRKCGADMGRWMKYKSAAAKRWNKRASVKHPNDWDPIDTAPKDGTDIVVYCPPAHGLTHMVCVCAWHEDAGFCVCELRTPTHWHALQTPGTTNTTKLICQMCGREFVPAKPSHRMCNGCVVTVIEEPEDSQKLRILRLMGKRRAIKSGNAGITLEGEIVDRRNHPEAMKYTSNAKDSQSQG